ncbi:phage tail protein [Cyclobacterium plantarum]|uniref:Phage tail protein n=1 Tax=Cyclobacterium plantarum TaxID=2716263 RepID=A0ABX0H1Z1_9BACT|nr:phage tail protein [Cyclobacterium plantarum]NHE55800.1 phage tail protein [Cyclobacterium plantarum]
MAKEAENNIWPLPRFFFEVDFGTGAAVPFQEVSGLDTEPQRMEYRHGNNPVFSHIKMPGMIKYGCVTLKKGIFKSDHQFWDWFKKVKMNTIERKTLIIKLCDGNGIPTMTWTLDKAFPVKITSSDLKSDADEIAVEAIEFYHEGLTVSNQ